MASYTILWHMPGYLPEMEPYPVECDTPGDVLRALKDAVEPMWDTDGGDIHTDTMQAILKDLHDLDKVGPAIQAEGMSYSLGDGYIIEAIPTVEA